LEKIQLMHKRNILEAGKRIEEAGKAVIFIHGRGGTAQGMMELQNLLPLEGFAVLAPQATNNTWYPYSFMAPAATNEPWLGSAVKTIHDLIDEVNAQGIASENLYLVGFSQGACLTLESVTRKAQRFGGIIAFTGGLIGQEIDMANYKGDFMGTPVAMTTGDPDPHIPIERFHRSIDILKEMGAEVRHKVYPGRPHTIIDDELTFGSWVFDRA
jgi:phospholipase/carboxylesterase